MTYADSNGRACAHIRKPEGDPVNRKPDIVSLKWVIGLINSQADAAEGDHREGREDPEALDVGGVPHGRCREGQENT